jgi:hypothetical protein
VLARFVGQLYEWQLFREKRNEEFQFESAESAKNG